MKVICPAYVRTSIPELVGWFRSHPPGTEPRLSIALLPCFTGDRSIRNGGRSLFEDVGSTRIDLACPKCQQLFKVRLRKLQFGADLVCRLCRHEFAAKEIADRPEVHEALARMQQIVKQRVRPMQPRSTRGDAEDHDGEIQDHHSARTTRPARHQNEDRVRASRLIARPARRTS